jgi:hypothetical protein
MLVLFNSYKMNTNDIRMFQKPFAIGTGQVPVRIQRQIIKLQNNDRLNHVSAERNIEQTYRNTLEIFNALKTFAKKVRTLYGDAYACEKAFSVMKFQKKIKNLFPGLMIYMFIPNYAFVLQHANQTLTSLF